MAEGFNTPIKNQKDLLHIPPSPFLERLGYGTGVSVYKFDRSPKANTIRSPWALKVVKNAMKNTVYGKRLRIEADLLKQMKHPNIVGFRAFTETNKGSECLAMESCHISLGDLIENRSEENLRAFPPQQILTLTSQISRALDYLHTRVLLLHGDIKSHNILVVHDFSVCKLCDFGVSLPLTQTGELDRIKAGSEAEYVGTRCWNAPEIEADPKQVTTKADIFAFGLVLWEMIALDIPHTENLFEENSDSENSNDFETFGTRPSIPMEMLGEDPEVYRNPLSLFYCCTEENPKERPTALQLSESSYEMFMNNNTTYSKPDLTDSEFDGQNNFKN